MINFRNRNELWPSVVSVCAVLVLAGSFVFMLMPVPTTKGAQKAVDKQKLDIKIATKKAIETVQESQAQIVKTTWIGSAEDVGTSVLKRLTAIAKSRNVKLAGVRPQKAGLADDLSTLPFTVTVQGAFVDVLAFERDIDDPANRLGVSLVQLSSADPNTDHVIANVGVLAYLAPKTPVSLAPPVHRIPTPKKGATHA